MTILITDDHRTFRAAMISLLKASLNPDTVYLEAKNGAEALACLQEINVDLVFLDVCMPHMNGYETCKKIVELPNHPPIIVLTGVIEAASVSHFVALGLSFLTKDASIEQINEAIAVTLAGGQFIEPGLMEGNLPNRFSIEMSKQEKNLIVKLTEGLSSKEIAQQMEVTPKTVETYRERLLKKLKVKNVAELISFAFKTGHDKG
jgi:DNA-binding NarL/FixJ family response regulator